MGSMILKSRDGLREEPQSSLPSHASLSLQDDRALHHDVYSVVIDWIHAGTLRPGDRVSEAAIARQLGISRGPVREAISRLDHEGLVVRRPRRGAVVASLTIKDLEDISTVRQLIEGQAARTACQLISPEDIETLEALIASMESHANEGQWTETVLLNGQFHETVVRISSNRILEKMWKSLNPLAWLLAPAASPNKAHDVTSIVVRHRQLLDDLRNGDPDRADQAFRQHVARSSQSAMANLAKTQQLN